MGRWRRTARAAALAWFCILIVWQDQIDNRYDDSVKVFLVRLAITLAAVAPAWLLPRSD